MSNIWLQFYGSFSAWNSISNICVQFARSLSTYFSGVALDNYLEWDESWSDYAGEKFARTEQCDRSIPWLSLRRFQQHVPDAPVGFYYGIPNESWRSLSSHAYKVGGFVCETDRIPESWVDICNRLDLIFVPSEFCRQAFVESGVNTEVLVVNHGVESAFQPSAIKCVDEGPFIFYNCFSFYSFPERKSCEELIRCFLKAFPGDKNVRLRLRTHDFGPIREYKKKYNFGEQIEVIPLKYGPLSELAKSFDTVHCTVHPSKGEGFGLVPFQSLACETPVIAPAVTGMCEYLNNDNALLLKPGCRVHGKSWGNQPGHYYSVNEDALISSLRYMQDNWDSEYQKARRAGPIMRKKFSWDRVLRPALQRLESVYTDHVKSCGYR